MVRRRCGKGVAGKGSSQILQNEKEIPRLTGRSCGEFPGIGRTLPSRHSLQIEVLVPVAAAPLGTTRGGWLVLRASGLRPVCRGTLGYGQIAFPLPYRQR